MSEYHYTVILQSEPEGGYSVTVPALPGCYTQGETQEEALQNAQEAILLYVETLIAQNEPVPQEHQPAAILQTVKVVA